MNKGKYAQRSVRLVKPGARTIYSMRSADADAVSVGTVIGETNVAWYVRVIDGPGRQRVEKVWKKDATWSTQRHVVIDKRIATLYHEISDLALMVDERLQRIERLRDDRQRLLANKQVRDGWCRREAIHEIPGLPEKMS